jgi:hypothetical protein
MKKAMNGMMNTSLGRATAIGLLGLTLIPVTGCGWGGSEKGRGPVVHEERSTGAFQELKLMLPATVVLLNGDAFKVRIEGQENLLPLIQTIVEDDTLKVFSDKSLKANPEIRIILTAPRYDKVEIRGYAKVKAPETIETERLEIEIKGAGNVEMPLAVKEVEIEISGSGKVLLRGTADEIKIEISGSGEVDASRLLTRKAETKISGSGDIRLHTEEYLRGFIRGSGKIRYTGRISEHQIQIAGSGSVQHLGEAMQP